MAQTLANTEQKPDRSAIMAQCERHLGGRGLYPLAEVLSALGVEAASEDRPDFYGSGGPVERFEEEIATLLGKEAAVVFPTGTMTQQIALRIWSERKNSSVVAFHPTCHLETHEQKAYSVLHGLRAILVGDPQRLMTLENLQAIAGPVAALLIELPQREIGGQLPAWEDLQAHIAWAHERGAAVHMDGARLWESAPFYGRSYAEIAAPFDSVYVSFYKALGALSGAALAGPADFIAEARVWRRRLGGDLFHFYPIVLSARAALRDRLPQMLERCQKAVEIAAVLSSMDGIEVKPNPPHTNMMHIYLRGEKDVLLDRSLRIANGDRVALFNGLSPTEIPGWHMCELAVHDTATTLTAEEIRQYFGLLMHNAASRDTGEE